MTDTKVFGTQIVTFLTRAWKNCSGQDLIEYTLMGGFVAVTAGAILPHVASTISTTLGHVSSAMIAASGQCIQPHHR
jgi:pilus assembly protein Flp/PilA